LHFCGGDAQTRPFEGVLRTKRPGITVRPFFGRTCCARGGALGFGAPRLAIEVACPTCRAARGRGSGSGTSKGTGRVRGRRTKTEASRRTATAPTAVMATFSLPRPVPPARVVPFTSAAWGVAPRRVLTANSKRLPSRSSLRHPTRCGAGGSRWSDAVGRRSGRSIGNVADGPMLQSNICYGTVFCDRSDNSAPRPILTSSLYEPPILPSG